MDTNKLKIGTEASFFPPFEKGINTIKRLEEAGYDSIWLADHLMAWVPESIWTPEITGLATKEINTPHLYFDALCTLSIAAWNTQKIQIGTAVTETFRRHPAMLAQAFLTLDHLSKGRAILGLGAGEGENVTPYGIKWNKPASRLEEAVKIIKLLWKSDQKVDFDGKIWKLKDAVLGLPPYKKGHYPPIWIAAMGPKMLDITGRLGDGWLPVNLDTNSYKEGLNIIKSSAKKAGRNPAEITPALYSYIIIDEDYDECLRLLETPMSKNFILIASNETFRRYGCTHPFGENFYGLRDYIPSRYDRETVLDAIEKVPTELCSDSYLIGTPEDIVEKIEKYMEIGLKHIVLFNITYYCDANKIKSSFGGLKKILEHFKV
ncbi:MAG: LLM class flavin-dependent oxidoreductase [Candidatus Helarchaeota archaeon]|nr:LLM class flavin-dependent oxidoreductase [Candidatus Helarchaeota archaeon]